MKEWLLRLALVGVGLIIAVSALEFGLGRFAPSYEVLHRGSEILHEPDTLIGGKGIPNKEGEFRHGSIESVVKINSHGFRDRERRYEKAGDVFRIVVIGDSFTEALQVPLEQTYTYILEERLNSEGGKRFEVINLAISGFGTAQEYLTLKHYGLKYRPDFIILAFFPGNDVQNNSLTLESEFEGRSINDRKQPFFVLNDGKLKSLPFEIGVKDSVKRKREVKGGIFRRVKRFLTGSFPNIHYLLVDRVRGTPWLADYLLGSGAKKPKRSEIPLFYQVYAEEYTPEWQDAWEVTKRLILKLEEELETSKIGFMVVVIADEFEFRPDRWNEILERYPQMQAAGFDPGKPERILLSFLEANDIHYLLLRPEFERYSKEVGEDLHFHLPGENHWNAKGHELAARVIYKELESDESVPLD